jgi:hypothetical protein
MKTYGWFKEEFNKAKDTPKFKQETFNNKVHSKYLPYYQYAKITPGCDINCGDCDQFVTCGPIPECLSEKGNLPCKNCLFWTGYTLDEEYIDKNIDLMKHIIIL